MKIIVPNHYTLSSAPAFEPVTLDEAKAQCAVDSDEFDDYIRKLVNSATEYLQTVEDRQFCTATWIAKLDAFPCGTYDEIRLAKSPLASISEISYIDSDGDSTVWSSSNYRVDTNSEPGRITLADGASWPTTQLVSNAVSITFVAGQAQASVPQRFKQHILMLVSEWWWNRETSMESTSKESEWHKRQLWANRVKQFV